MENPSDLRHHMADISANARAYTRMCENASLNEPKDIEQEAYKDSIALDSLKTPMLGLPYSTP